MISKIILALTIITLASANLHLNIKYKNVLEGPEELTERIAQEIYMNFRSPHYERSEYRFKVFFETLKEIKEHNAGQHSWRQGINDYSDMTFDEFKQDRLMVPQNCSATSSMKLKPEFRNAAIPENY